MIKKLSPATIAAQAAGFVDALSGGVVPPIQPSTTFIRDRNYQPVNDANIYGRDDNDQVRLAEKILCQLEGAEAGLLFPSGMASIAGIFRTLVSGSTVILQTGIYWGTTQWVRDFCSRRQVKLIEIDASDFAALDAACNAYKPDLVFVETPSNPWLKVVDIERTANLVHQVGGKLVVDSTAATPILTCPLNLGADLVMHSATKAINGHSDVLAGFLATRNNDEMWTAIARDRHDAGAIIGAYETSQLIRGMRTLALRVERMSENAFEVAQFLEQHSQVEEVLYPGLASNVGHVIAAKQMKGGYGSLLSFLARGDKARALEVAGKLKLFHRATSLGGVESLVEHRYTIEPDTGIPPNLLRLSVGIEQVDDLIADLDQALN